MIRLLIVDDSALMRRLLGTIFTADEGFEVAFARDGIQAIDQLAAFRPDVITLDVHMPGLDGLATLDRIMIERPCPVVMVSNLTTEGADETLEAMALGAVDFVAKPQGPVSLEIDAIAPALIATVRAAAEARLSRTTRLTERVRRRSGLAANAPPRRAAARARAPSAPITPSEIELVLIGSSTGGPPALDAVLKPLPADFPAPILIAQHMPASFTGALARRLDRLCALSVHEVTGPTPLEPGHAYIGRGDADVIVARRRGRLMALPAPSSAAYRWHPSVDRMVVSAAGQVAPKRLAAILLTGMGADGAGTMTALRAAGGRTIAEAEETAVVWGMPGALVQMGGAERIEPLERIADALLAIVAQ